MHDWIRMVVHTNIYICTCTSIQSHGDSSKTLNTREDLNCVKLQGKQKYSNTVFTLRKSENVWKRTVHTFNLFRKQSTNEKKNSIRGAAKKGEEKSLTIWKAETSCLSLFFLGEKLKESETFNGWIF